MDLATLRRTRDDELKERESFETNFHAAVASAEELLDKNSSFSSGRSSAGDDGSQVTGSGTAIATGPPAFKLPTIHLPTFSGRYQDWLGFHDSYTSLIHNNKSIPKIHKFHYLRASLKDSASLIIQSLDFSADNYDIAWELICERYNNKRLLINNHIKALFEIEIITRESSRSLRNLVDTINKNVRSLKALNLPIQYWDAMIIHLASSKLDSVTSREWEEERNKLKDIPTLQQFNDFIKGRADLLETIEINHNKQRRHSDIPHMRPKTFVASPTNATRSSCHLCKGSHSIFQCFRFKSLPIESRIKKAKELKLCTNCLKQGHDVNKCTLGPCKLCFQKHNSLLHLEEKSCSKSKPSTESQQSSSRECVVLTASNNSSQTESLQSQYNNNEITLSCTNHNQVLLSTVQIGISDHLGKIHKVRALLDNGSTSSFITEQLICKLKLKSQKTQVHIQGLHNQMSQITNRCEVNIHSLVNNEFSRQITCFIVPCITQMLPTHKVNTNSFKIPQHIQLADPAFHTPAEVEMLLGADLFWEVLGNNTISLGKNRPSLNETKLGWLVSGVSRTHIPNSNKSNSFKHNSSQTTVHCHFLNTSDTELQKKLDHYFECESFSDPPRHTKDEIQCETIFAQTTIRHPDGRFVVNIPLKTSPTILGDSYEQANARFFALERRFSRDSNFKTKYTEFMKEYLELGHMTEVIDPPKGKPAYYLPHHGVLRETSLTTKLRTVFDASAPTTSGYSFNDIQLIGPPVQDDLMSILLRFRQHKFIVTADIEKMYRMVLINPEQRSLQQILWRSDPTEKLRVYELNTVTYGTASAPYLATKCLTQLGHDYLNDPLTVNSTPHTQVRTLTGTTILHDFYVDDLVTGNDDPLLLTNICKEVTKQLKKAHFHLRKWKSNKENLLQDIYEFNKSDNDPFLTIKNDQITKTLGILWDSKNDKLLFSSSPVTDQNTPNQTKRSILSKIAQIFDPLGLINPCLLQAKILLQKLWADNIAWDDTISPEFHKQWHDFLKYLPYLNNIQIPRHVICDSPIKIEIHAFSDASIHAYSACIYIRSTSYNGSINVNLLVAKSRVAPFKKNITIPRLELCGAVLAMRLAKKVKSSLRLHIDSESYWSDSTIVLGWVKMPKSKLKQYVYNRVTEITDNTSSSNWYHVPTSMNPADIGSRGLNPQQLGSNKLWFCGPDFLHHNTILLPPQPLNNNTDTLPELKLLCHITNESADHEYLQRYSTFSKLQRVMAYILRFIRNCRLPKNKHIGHLKVFEINHSQTILCKLVQREMFTKQYFLLHSKDSLPPKDQLLNLNPFMDNTGTMRVGGRLLNSNLSYDTKHPILLHANHYVTQLLVQHYHRVLLHAGPQLMLSTLRQRFWIIGGRNLARKIARNCITCCRYSNKSIQPIMGNLPKERLHADFPFQNTAVDYAGPVMIADRKGRGCRLLKAYICVFVCLTVRAVHVELVTELSTNGFLACLNRFIARRGRPAKIFSDNGRNFVGACNELANFLNLKSNEISLYAAESQIEFKFSPAYSPHFNGLVEGCVKSIKYHLKRVIGLTNLTYEELTTLLVQVEAILNSRPLTPLSSDPSDLTALTPSHFLLGRTIMMTAPQVHDEEQNKNIATLTRYKRVEHLKSQFWQRFNREYISELQRRNKWCKPAEGLRLHQMVVVKDDRLPPNRWLLGRISHVYPGTDGVARVADVITSSGTLRRAFNRLIPLPILEPDVPTPAAC
ncbi:hypothetical protein ABMA28_016409 [Loxostege sticticalis]|uniref:Integrase catalytic domain-containing protein n=2 Tax=Loxostege sticticalis TaxID=481309 RepID=A0ABD0T8R2_LOXSC